MGDYMIEEKGFQVIIWSDLKGAEDEVVDKFCDDLINFVEARGCGIGGEIGYYTSVFCARLDEEPCTEEDRQALDQYLKNNSLVKKNTRLANLQSTLLLS